MMLDAKARVRKPHQVNQPTKPSEQVTTDNNQFETVRMLEFDSTYNHPTSTFW